MNQDLFIHVYPLMISKVDIIPRAVTVDKMSKLKWSVSELILQGKIIVCCMFTQRSNELKIESVLRLSGGIVGRAIVKEKVLTTFKLYYCVASGIAW